MFYKVTLQDHVRVAPNLFGSDGKLSILKELKNKYDGFISKDIGIFIDILQVSESQDGIIIPGDGAAFYHVVFEALVYKIDLQEIVLGKIRDITDFGAFVSIGPIEGMVHVSQTMDDFVSFSKDKVLQGKQTSRTLKVGDHVRARAIALSFKDIANPKFGLTMRQIGLGKLDWVEEDYNKGKKKKAEA
ncbi:MAG: DNA-directed RNA polymerase [Candidatus Woesearchaeota archaeon]